MKLFLWVLIVQLSSSTINDVNGSENGKSKNGESVGENSLSPTMKSARLKAYLKTPAGKFHQKELLSSLPVGQRLRGLGINAASIGLGIALQNPAMVYSAGARQAVYGNGDLEWAKKQLLSEKDPHETPFDATRFTADSSSINALSFALLWEAGLKAVEKYEFHDKKTALYEGLALGSSLIVGPVVGAGFSKFYVLPVIQRKKTEDRARRQVLNRLKTEEVSRPLRAAIAEHIAKNPDAKAEPFSGTEAGKAFIADTRQALRLEITEPKVTENHPYAEKIRASLRKNPGNDADMHKLEKFYDRLTDQTIRNFLAPYVNRIEKRERILQKRF